LPQLLSHPELVSGSFL